MDTSSQFMDLEAETEGTKTITGAGIAANLKKRKQAKTISRQ